MPGDKWTGSKFINVQLRMLIQLKLKWHEDPLKREN